MGRGLWIVLAAALVGAIDQEAQAFGGQRCEAESIAQELSDGELDAIALLHECPVANDSVEKGTAVRTIDIRISREAAGKAMVTLMSKLGIKGMKGKVSFWYCLELDVWFTIEKTVDVSNKERYFILDPVRRSSFALNREGDALVLARRHALRSFLADAAYNLLDVANIATKTDQGPKGLAWIQAAIEEVSIRRDVLEESRKQYREELQRAAADATVARSGLHPQLDKLRNGVKTAEGALSEAKEKLRSLITAREELRLVLKGVLD